MNKKRILSIVSLLLALAIYQNARAAIDLVSFTAKQQGRSILIEWETATEFDVAGFVIARNTNPTLIYEDVSDFIPAEGSGVIGANYQFLDDNVSEDVLYYYLLRVINTDQSEEQFGPILMMITLKDVFIPLIVTP